MTFKLGIPAMSRYVISLCAASLCLSALAQSNSTAFPTDKDSLDGDHLRLRTNVSGFKDSGSTETTPKLFCAPVGTGMAVREELSDGNLVVRFYDIPSEPAGEVTKEALAACKPEDRVNLYTSYTILKNKLMTFDFKRSGVAFGGLVIPFKFRLGGDRGVVSSSTVAPYVGIRTRYLQGFGVSFTPVLSAGLGLVPVSNSATNTTETKSALSFAAGFVMTSSKSEQFTAGLVVGRDVLSKSDSALDPNVNKAWLSFYLGVAM